VALKVGKSRALVANALRLLKLPLDLQDYLRDGRLSVGHAKVILGLSVPEQQRLAADRVIKGSLNVRQTEDLVTHLTRGERGGGREERAEGRGENLSSLPSPLSAHVASLENKLRERLGTKVQLRYRQGRGALDIRFFSDDELERILQIIGVNVNDPT
jgi:ParB family chromosome partitioning protein